MKALRIVFIISIPFICAILGGVLFSLAQRIPFGRWELILDNQYPSHGMASAPVEVITVDFKDLYVKSEDGEIYQCESEDKTCTKIAQLPSNVLSVYPPPLHGTFPWQTPRFDGNVKDILEVQLPSPESIAYEYYILASDGSIWFWRGRNDGIAEWLSCVAFSALCFFLGGLISASKAQILRKWS